MRKPESVSQRASGNGQEVQALVLSEQGFGHVDQTNPEVNDCPQNLGTRALGPPAHCRMHAETPTRVFSLRIS
jgi:hypothetical protein